MSFNADQYTLPKGLKNKSFGEFKEYIKRGRPYLKAKDIQALYDNLHGNDIPTAQESTEDSPE